MGNFILNKRNNPNSFLTLGLKGTVPKKGDNLLLEKNVQFLKKGPVPFFLSSFLFGPAQFFLDKVEVVSPGRGDKMKLIIAAFDLDRIILNH
jgi:hypothetical protein